MGIIEKMTDPEILKTLGVSEKLLGALIVMLLGLATCIVVLFVIMIALKLLKLIFERKDDPGATPPGQKADSTQTTVASSAPAPAVGTVQSTNSLSNRITTATQIAVDSTAVQNTAATQPDSFTPPPENAIIAAISAAIHHLRNGRPFLIRNIYALPEREAWSAAALSDSFRNRNPVLKENLNENI